MIGWIILGMIGGVAALLLLLVTRRIRARLTYSEGEGLLAVVYYAGFEIWRYPEKEERQKPLSAAKLRKKLLQKEKKKLLDVKLLEGNLSKPRELLAELTDLWLILKDGLYPHLDTRITDLQLTVGGEDAATVALLYGEITQLISAILELLDGGKRLRFDRRDSISVNADFSGGSSFFKMDLTLQIRVYQYIFSAVGTTWRRLRAEEAQQNGDAVPWSLVHPIGQISKKEKGGNH